MTFEGKVVARTNRLMPWMMVSLTLAMSAFAAPLGALVVPNPLSLILLATWIGSLLVWLLVLVGVLKVIGRRGCWLLLTAPIAFFWVGFLLWIHWHPLGICIPDRPNGPPACYI